MSSDTDRLEKEAESHRANLDSTFDAIRDRLSVGQIVDEFSGYLKEGPGADTVKNLGRQVRDNPLALGLVGAGLAWLLLGDGARARGHEASERLSRWREDRDYDRFEEAFPSSDEKDPSAQSGTARSTSHGPGIGSRLAGTAGSVRDAGSRTTSSLAAGTHHAGESLSDASSSVADATRRGYHDATDALSGAGSSAMEGARRSGRQAYRAGSRAQRNIADLIHEEPLVFGAVAVAIGAAVGAMLPATRQEDEWVGDLRDDLRDEVYEQSMEAARSAEHVAEKAYQAANETADEKGLTPSPDAGSQTVAEKAGDVARSASETARTEAKKEGLY